MPVSWSYPARHRWLFSVWKAIKVKVIVFRPNLRLLPCGNSKSPVPVAVDKQVGNLASYPLFNSSAGLGFSGKTR
jgi:hypothetical protein